MDQTRTYWRLCSICKKEIPFKGPYYACSVSTCNQKRTFLSFCSMSCFLEHVPVLRHRDAWAEEKGAPSFEQWAAQTSAPEPETGSSAAAPVRAPRAAEKPIEKPAVFIRAAPGVEPDRPIGNPEGQRLELNDADLPADILIVASKLKQYIRARSGMKTSDGVMDALSEIVRGLCDQAIRNAATAERKTVMDRDFALDKLALRRR